MPSILGEFDLPLGSLYAKLLVFPTARALRRCWRVVVKKPLSRGRVLGAVNGLYREHIPTNGDRPYLACDARYFCVIGLIQSHLSMDVITHEAVHAAFCYTKRRSRAPWAPFAHINDEETLAYPAGRLARLINNVLWKHNLYLI